MRLTSPLTRYFRAIKSLNKALEYARKAGSQGNIEAREALDTATLLVVEYLLAYPLYGAHPFDHLWLTFKRPQSPGGYRDGH